MSALVAKAAAGTSLASQTVAGNEIAMSRGLAKLVEEAVEGRTFLLVPGVAEHLPEARDRLRSLEMLFTPPDAQRVRMWGLIINGLIGAPIEKEELSGKLSLLLEALQELPAGVLTRHSARRVAETTEFWPSLKSIMAVLRPEARKLELMRHGLRTVLSAAALPPRDDETRKPENPEEVQAVLSTFRERFNRAMAPVRASSIPADGTGRGTAETPIPRSELTPAQRLTALKLAAEVETNPTLRRLLEERAARLASHLAGTESHPTETTQGA